MSMITTATRMYLTRSFKPFTFAPDDGRRKIDLAAVEKPGLYVHIPFCRTLCNFCPYCKVVYDSDLYNRYMDALKTEIDLVSAEISIPKEVSSLYFGGGSPALAADRLGEIITHLQKYYRITEGIGVELHPQDVNTDTLQKLKAAGVTRISIGIQSFQKHFQDLLGRSVIDIQEMKKVLSSTEFETISMDFIFALPGQKATDLKLDIQRAFDCGANHTAIYPFIDFSFTSTPLKEMRKNEKRHLLNEITEYFRSIGCHRDSIWTFAKSRTHKYSSMTRDNFIGFGCSATSLLKDQFRINTFSVEEYCKRINHGLLPTALHCDFSVRQRMIYWLFWRAYTTKVVIADFEKFFGVPLKKAFGAELTIARLTGMIIEKNGVLELTDKGAFYFHYYESFYTLAYIDKMWGLLRHEAFPRSMKL